MDGAYLDHASTTRVRPEALAAVVEQLGPGAIGNPSGAHAMARAARRRVDDARDLIADLLGVGFGEVAFTSGGTESDNLAVAGAAHRGEVLVSAVEHHAVLETARHVGGTVVAVRPDATIDMDALAERLHPGVGLVSVMAVNNEVGAIAPLAEVVELVREKSPDALVHSDAAQAFCWLDLAAGPPIDLVTLSAHKFGGPQGVGVLAGPGLTQLRARQLGGGQERGLRSGTHNVAGIVATAAAAGAVAAERAETVVRVAELRDRLADGLMAAVPGLVETVHRSAKVAGNCHVCFEDVDGEALVFLLDRAGVYVSAGASCSSGAVEVSHVLAAMGVDPRFGRGAVRFSLGPSSTDADVDRALAVVPEAVARLRRGAVSRVEASRR